MKTRATIEMMQAGFGWPSGNGCTFAEHWRNESRAQRRPHRCKFLLQHKLEKKGTSPKTWYWAVFQVGKFEMAENQNDPAEIDPNRSLNFLQFLENFSGGYIPPGGAGKCAHYEPAQSLSQSVTAIWGAE
jgi:hypothetical protein